MAAQTEHTSDDGLTALCGVSLVVDEPSGPPCPACQERAGRTRWMWPRIGPALLTLLWVIALCVGRWAADLATPARASVAVGSSLAVLSVVMLTAGRVRPDDDNTGGE